jgi:hypothetical protein
MPDPTSWLRVIIKSREDAQSGLALFVVLRPVETSKARACRLEIRDFEISSQDNNNTASERATMEYSQRK